MRKISALLLTAMASGCVAQATLTRQHNPKSEVEAGAVTISASAPMRWENVVGELRPEFNSTTARDYLDDVLPSVQQDVSSRRESTAVQFGADVSGRTVEQSQTTQTAADGTSATTGTRTVRQAPAAPLRSENGSQVIDGRISGPDANIFRPGDGPANTWPAQNTDNVDPILQYRAAVALHQELVLLDNYLDSAYDPCLQEAWLVRTRLVATPYARNQPIDAYSRIYASFRQTREERWSNNGVRLVPLLVTDNFERSDARRYEQLASQVQGSLNGVSGVVAAGLGFNRYLNNLNAILGSQYNNLLTIAQIEDYSLMVRLGAAFSPTSRYEMQSRSYDITFLVAIDKERLVPNRAVSLGFFAETEMRDAESGALLQAVRPALRDDLEDRLERNEPAEGYQREIWQRVLDAVRTGVVGDSVELEDVQSLNVPDELRSDLVRWFLASYGSTAVMPVGRGQVALPLEQDGTFRDSLATGLLARVVGPPGLSPNHFRAELLVGGTGQAITFAANSVTVNPQGVVDAVFPSLGAVGVNSDNRDVRLRLMLQCPTENRAQDSRDIPSRDYRLLRDRAILASAPVQAASFGAEAVGGVQTLQPHGQSASSDARIRIHAMNERSNPYIAGYEIQVTGAVLNRARLLGPGARDLDAVRDDSNTIRVGRDFAAYSLALANLVVDTPVNVTVRAVGAQGGEISGEESIVTFNVKHVESTEEPQAPQDSPP